MTLLDFRTCGGGREKNNIYLSRYGESVRAPRIDFCSDDGPGVRLKGTTGACELLAKSRIRRIGQARP